MNDKNKPVRPSLDQIMLNWAKEHKSVIKESFIEELSKKVDEEKEKHYEKKIIKHINKTI